MLLNGGPELPMKLPIISPWIDADLGIPESEVSAALDAQIGRRVVKTHTPVDGFPVWDGVTVVSVYRHPLDVFLSLRKHYANMTISKVGDPMLAPLHVSVSSYLLGRLDREDYSSKTLESVASHYVSMLETVRTPKPVALHYSDMIADNRHAVARLAEIAEVDADDALIDAIVNASSFASMKAKAADFVPAGGTGLFRSDGNFFDSGQSQKWLGKINEQELELYEKRLAQLIPDAVARDWFQHGSSTRPVV
jgi:aryl sulfotransferase